MKITETSALHEENWTKFWPIPFITKFEICSLCESVKVVSPHTDETTGYCDDVWFYRKRARLRSITLDRVLLPRGLFLNPWATFGVMKDVFYIGRCIGHTFLRHKILPTPILIPTISFIIRTVSYRTSCFVMVSYPCLLSISAPLSSPVLDSYFDPWYFSDRPLDTVSLHCSRVDLILPTISRILGIFLSFMMSDLLLFNFKFLILSSSQPFFNFFMENLLLH